MVSFTSIVHSKFKLIRYVNTSNFVGYISAIFVIIIPMYII